MLRRTKSAQADLRQYILDAALHEFSLKGYHSAIVDDIAARVEVSKGTIYLNFKSKRALFVAAARREFSRLHTYLEGIVKEESLGPLGRLESLIVAALTYYADHPEFCNILRVIRLPGGPELGQEAQAVASDDMRRFREMVEGLLQEAVRRGEAKPGPARVAAPMVLALLDGLMFQWILDPQAVPLRQLAPNFARAFLEGLAESQHPSA